MRNLAPNLACLKEDFGPRKLVCQFLEELTKTDNHCLTITHALSKLRSHLRRHGDTQVNVFNMKMNLSP